MNRYRSTSLQRLCYCFQPRLILASCCNPSAEPCHFFRTKLAFGVSRLRLWTSCGVLHLRIKIGLAALRAMQRVARSTGMRLFVSQFDSESVAAQPTNTPPVKEGSKAMKLCNGEERWFASNCFTCGPPPEPTPVNIAEPGSGPKGITPSVTPPKNAAS